MRRDNTHVQEEGGTGVGSAAGCTGGGARVAVPRQASIINKEKARHPPGLLGIGRNGYFFGTWITMLPPLISVVGVVSSPVPISLSYTTAFVDFTQILIRNRSPALPPS